MTSLDPANPDFAARARDVVFFGVDFDGVMTENTVYVFEDGREMVRCSRLEGFGLRRVEKTGVEVMIVSTEKNPVVTARAKKLALPVQQDIANKVEAMEAILSARALRWDQAAFIGNDLNDRGVLERVGLPIVVADAHESLDDLAGAFRTRRGGGHGCVREACDAIAAVREDGAERDVN